MPPKKGAIVETPLGLAKVSELHTPRETIGMKFEDGKRVTVPLAEMGCSKGTGCPCTVSRETLEEAGGTATSLAFAALDREAEAAAAPPAPAPKPRSGRGGGGRQRSALRRAGVQRSAAPAEKTPEGADTAPEAAKGEGGRKRRRRGGRGGGEGAAAGGQAAKPAEGAKAPKADELPGQQARPERRRAAASAGGAVRVRAAGAETLRRRDELDTCRRSSAGQSTALVMRGSGVRIPSSAPSIYQRGPSGPRSLFCVRSLRI